MGAIVNVRLAPGTDVEEAKRKIKAALRHITDEPVTVIVTTREIKSITPKQQPFTNLIRPNYL